MSKWKITSIVIILLFLVFLWVEIISNFIESSDFSKQNDALIANINKMTEENEKIEQDIEFYNIPENLEKKLREGFNYKNPGEKMIIVVPQN